jgi:hypothetical protein
MKKILLTVMMLFATQAFADTYLAMAYNDKVRIVLSKAKCSKAGYRAAAQRIDKQFLRGCWSFVDAKKNEIRIAWEGDGSDFSVFPITRFEPITDDEPTKQSKSERSPAF